MTFYVISKITAALIGVYSMIRTSETLANLPIKAQHGTHYDAFSPYGNLLD